MNDKMMGRDKALRARHEAHDGETVECNLTAALWLSKTAVMISCAGQVYVWNLRNNYASCIDRLPRDDRTLVSSMDVVLNDTLILLAENGQQIGVWHRIFRRCSWRCIKILRLFNHRDDTTDVSCVLAMDPGEQVVTMTDVKSESFFLMHFNGTARAFDTVTAVPSDTAIYSFGLTPMRRGIAPGGAIVTGGTGATGTSSGVGGCGGNVACVSGTARGVGVWHPLLEHLRTSLICGGCAGKLSR